MFKQFLCIILLCCLVQLSYGQIEGKWILTSVHDLKNDKLFTKDKLPFSNDIVLNIEPGKISYTMMCNNCFQGYKISDKQNIEIGMSACTRKFCEGENEYWNYIQFEKCKGFTVENNVLKFTGSDWTYKFDRHDGD